ncbi:MAG: hypothetical protein KGH59_02530 [Candidatus Micrarchaeota archaeon]|nr:hypothetical protein [Candidatus Micrarchaeota archaeon]MDE1804633.1 hypothetical protein [Candidatus Micrarchaeota archaeon]MDE1846785.1 hypothetical protein [Candidatus Micrarchaeota archaeon]
MEKEFQDLKEMVGRLSKSNETGVEEGSGLSSVIVKYLFEEREKTNKTLRAISERLRKLEEDLSTMDESEPQEMEFAPEMPSKKQIPLSRLDAQILTIAQQKELVCADDIKTDMNYKGRNAACARLNRLYRAGLLDRFQLGHKVYFKYDAGKTTNTLIISPPQ